MTLGGGVGFMTAADSARVVAAVYTVSLLATVPVILAAIAALAVRTAGPEARTLVWRSSIVALLAVFVGRQLPLHWMAWVIPSTLAAPLVALGRLQVTMAAMHAGAGPADTLGFPAAEPTIVRLLLAVYLVGALLALGCTVSATLAMRRIARRARVLTDARWLRALEHSQRALNLRRAVRLCMSSEVTVPMTWGIMRPVVLLPALAVHWSDDQRIMVLHHELGHARAADWLFALAARVAGALYWFHPGVWWIGRQMRDDCELACDGRVIAAGVRRSDYAELLVDAASNQRRWLPLTATSSVLALSRRRGLRARLAAVLDPHTRVRPLARRWVAVAATATLAVAAPMSVVQLAPTRAVLTTLMRDTRWESRAYAVLGLAQRADSVAVARTAAMLDPNPRVRAWARYALAERGAAGARAELPALLRD